MALFHFFSYGWVIFHCIYVPHLCPIICQWTFSFFHVLAIWTVHYWTLGCMYLSFLIRVLSRCMHRRGIAGLDTNSILVFWGHFIQFRLYFLSLECIMYFIHCFMCIISPPQWCEEADVFTHILQTRLKLREARSPMCNHHMCSVQSCLTLRPHGL